MKTCKMGCGKMKSGGAATKPIKKMKSGGAATLKDIINKNGVAMSGTTGPMMMKKGGSSSLPICKGGKVRMPDGSCGDRKFKSGGFKDLSGDGKITKKDVLIGRGVIKKPIKKK